MRVEYHKEYSGNLGREMEFKVYGHGGKPVLAVPCQNGRFYDWENFGMLDTLADWLDRGRIQLFTVDTIDGETVSKIGGNPYERVRLHERWYRYVTEELLARIHAINGTGQPLLATGFSMGAYHAGNFFFRRPDLFDSVMPSRNARHGHLFTWQGIININNAKYELDNSPIDAECDCPVCQRHSRAYIRHLLKAGEMLGMRLAVMHNLYFYNTLMEKIRAALDEGRYEQFRAQMIPLLGRRI